MNTTLKQSLAVKTKAAVLKGILWIIQLLKHLLILALLLLLTPIIQIIVLVALVKICEINNVPFTDRRQIAIRYSLFESHVVQSRIVAKYKDQALPHTHGDHQLVQRVFNQVFEQVKHARPGTDWKLYVIDSPSKYLYS